MWTQTEPISSSFRRTSPVTRLKLVSIYHTSDGVASRGLDHFFFFNFNQELPVVIRPLIHSKVPTVLLFYCISLRTPQFMWGLLTDLSLSFFSFSPHIEIFDTFMYSWSKNYSVTLHNKCTWLRSYTFVAFSKGVSAGYLLLWGSKQKKKCRPLIGHKETTKINSRAWLF